MITRRSFVTSAALAPLATAAPLGLPIGFQVYPVRQELAKDFPGTLKEFAAMGYRGVEMCSPPGYTSSGFGALAKMKAPEMKRAVATARPRMVRPPCAGSRRPGSSRRLSSRESPLGPRWRKPPPSRGPTAACTTISASPWTPTAGFWFRVQHGNGGFGFDSPNTVQSPLKTATFNANIKEEEPHLYILSVGIDQYKDRGVNLKYAVKDSRDIEQRLLTQAATSFFFGATATASSGSVPPLANNGRRGARTEASE